MIDVHAHLYDEQYLGDAKSYIQRAKENGVNQIICVGTDTRSNKEAIRIAEENENVFAAIGMYPEYASDFDGEFEKNLTSLAQNKKVVAIGEIGLDYHYEGYDKAKQKQCFVRQLEIANKLNLPIQIHCRDAMGDLIDILREHKNLLTRGGIVHCFSGSLESAKELISLNLSISFGGSLTFKNARNLQEVARNIPLEKIVLETDSPYLAPTPLRGTLNESANVRFVCDFIAKLKGITFEKVDKTTTQNAKRIFGIE